MTRPTPDVPYSPNDWYNATDTKLADRQSGSRWI